MQHNTITYSNTAITALSRSIVLFLLLRTLRTATVNRTTYPSIKIFKRQRKIRSLLSLTPNYKEQFTIPLLPRNFHNLPNNIVKTTRIMLHKTS